MVFLQNARPSLDDGPCSPAPTQESLSFIVSADGESESVLSLLKRLTSCKGAFIWMQREGLPPVMVTIGVAFRADLRPPGSCEKNSPPANVMEKSSQEGILSAPPPYSLLSYVLSNKDIPR